MPAAVKPATKLAQGIRDHRKRSGYARQTDLADAMRVNQATVSSWESGAGRPDHRLMLLLHDLTGVPLELFFADVDLDAVRTGSMTAELAVAA